MDLLNQRMLQECSLARDLKRIRDELSEQGAVSFRLNGWIELSFSLQDPADHPSFPMRPYQSLLLLEPEQAKLPGYLPADCNPQLRTLLHIASAMKSFQDISNETEIPMFQLFRLAAHLVYWKKAKLINTLDRHNIYTVNPATPASQLKEFAAEFTKSMSAAASSSASSSSSVVAVSAPASYHGASSQFSLPEVLAQFTLQKRLADHLTGLSQAAQQDRIRILTWLLQRDLVVQIHTYFFLIPPLPATPAGLPSSSSASSIAKQSRVSAAAAAPIVSFPGEPDEDLTQPPLPAPAPASSQREPSSVFAAMKEAPGSHSDSNLAAGGLGAAAAASKQRSPAAPLAPSPPSVSMDGDSPKPPPALPQSSVPRTGSAGMLPLRVQIYLDSIAQNTEQYRLFRRLCPYFDGKHHLEEIMWRENVSREQINIVISAYKDVIIRVNY